jgi:hypothetical protein
MKYGKDMVKCYDRWMYGQSKQPQIAMVNNMTDQSILCKLKHCWKYNFAKPCSFNIFFLLVFSE